MPAYSLRNAGPEALRTFVATVRCGCACVAD